jgi:RimJ/RimL family protein N-acetyltransferase
MVQVTPFPDLKTPLTDGVVSLRALSLDDVADVTRALQDEEIVRWTASIPSPYTESHARTWIEAQLDRWGTGAQAAFAIVDASDGSLLGSIAVIRPSDRPDCIAMMYWVARWSRRTGVATRALKLASGWALLLSPRELYLETVVGNIASEGVATKAGYSCTGTRQRVGRLGGQEDVTYALKTWVMPQNCSRKHLIVGS